MAASKLPGSPSDDRGPGLRGFTIFVLTLSCVVVALRFWSRSLNKAHSRGIPRIWWDDWLALIALPPLLATGALLLDMIRLGLGHHMWYLSPSVELPLLKRLFAIYYLYNTSLTLAKMSCLLFYTRIFNAPRTSPKFSTAVWMTHALNFGFYIGNLFTVTFNLSPEAQTAEGYRPNIAAVWLGSAVPSVLLDLILLALPMPMVWKLRVGRRRKFGIFCIFVCGYSVAFVSIGRLVTCSVKINDKMFPADLTYEGVPAIYWQAAEAPMTLLCVCLPGMLNLVRRCFGSEGRAAWKYTIDKRLMNSTPKSNSEVMNSNVAISYGDPKRIPSRHEDDQFSQASDRIMLQPVRTYNEHTTEVTRPDAARMLDRDLNLSTIRVQREIDITVDAT